jgi:hypothetical protein
MKRAHHEDDGERGPSAEVGDDACNIGVPFPNARIRAAWERSECIE